jgi:hypothetical protein
LAECAFESSAPNINRNDPAEFKPGERDSYSLKSGAGKMEKVSQTVARATTLKHSVFQS